MVRNSWKRAERNLDGWLQITLTPGLGDVVYHARTARALDQIIFAIGRQQHHWRELLTGENLCCGDAIQLWHADIHHHQIGRSSRARFTALWPSPTWPTTRYPWFSEFFFQIHADDGVIFRKNDACWHRPLSLYNVAPWIIRHMPEITSAFTAPKISHNIGAKRQDSVCRSITHRGCAAAVPPRSLFLMGHGRDCYPPRLVGRSPERHRHLLRRG